MNTAGCQLGYVARERYVDAWSLGGTPLLIVDIDVLHVTHERGPVHVLSKDITHVVTACNLGQFEVLASNVFLQP